MRYNPIDPELFEGNREQLAAELPEGAIAVVNSNDILPTCADGTLPLFQNSDLFYLSGIDQEESVLVLFPDYHDEEHREVLFVRRTSEQIAIWEGAKLTKEMATGISGVSKVYWTEEFDRVFGDLALQADEIFLNTNEHPRAATRVESRDDRFRRECMGRFPLHRYGRLAPIMHELRMIKSEVEIELLTKACEITREGFCRVLSFIRPDVYEYEIEAEFLHEFVRRGSKGFAYTPIIGSGSNACALHYLDNDQRCQAGDVVLMDVAAEYANYNADMTRSVPVSGRFTSRQRSVYDSVLKVFRESCDMLRPGVVIKEYQKEVGALMESELIGLGLLERDKVDAQDPDEPLYKKYFMHGTSHLLGLDVHDVGPQNLVVEEGMVFTVEPGLYIREEDLGVRLENDIVIGPDGNIDLMADIPIEAEEIEDMMNY